MRWLALDVGSRRVGVAVCDADESVATPLRPVAFHGALELAASVVRLVQTWDAEGVVVGVPVTQSGQGRGERRVAEVVAALRRESSIVVATVDEGGTTQAAEDLLAAAGVPRRQWAERVDGLAARLILERHLVERARSAAAPP